MTVDRGSFARTFVLTQPAQQFETIRSQCRRITVPPVSRMFCKDLARSRIVLLSPRRYEARSSNRIKFRVRYSPDRRRTAFRRDRPLIAICEQTQRKSRASLFVRVVYAVAKSVAIYSISFRVFMSD